MLIAGDWGTSNLRLFLVDVDGDIRAECRGRGAVDVQGAFAAELATLSSGWTAQLGALPVVLCGMVGSNFGWTQTRALNCPLDVAQIGRYCSEPAAGVRIVPGLTCRNTYGAPDFLRGEETQILGALTLLRDRAPVCRLLCLPGTHTKWVILDGSEVREFVSVPAGETYRALHDHTVLVRESEVAPLHPEGFARGLAAFNDHPAAQLLHRLFETRGRQLQGELTAAQAAAFLSGLLIASDVAGGLDLAAAAKINSPITLIGAPELTGLYAQALAAHGRDVCELDGTHAAVAGLRTVHRQSASEGAA